MAKRRRFIQLEPMDARTPAHLHAEIGARLEKIQRLMGFQHQRDFALHFGLLDTRVSNWLSGRSRISLDTALRICEETGLTLDYIYRGKTDGLPVGLLRELKNIRLAVS